MAAITQEQIVASYDLAISQARGELKKSEVIERLAAEYGMNRKSALYYVDALRHMRNGEVFTVTIKAEAAQYFLKRIATDFGVTAAYLALDSVNLHIAHYKNAAKRQHRLLKQIVADFEATVLSRPVTASELQHRLDADVVAAKAMPSIERSYKLPTAGSKPAMIYIETKAFIRNQFVIAEVLLRAQGICESCMMPAPFLRQSDGTPYLEVHHKVKLADGGDDTVENAMAVCPNCHRQAHYG